MGKKILGISALYHDSAAAIIHDGEIIAAAQEERFTRDKHTEDFPVHSIRYCLDEAGFSIDELDAVVFYDKPLLKFERLLETYYAYSPSGLRSFLKAIPVWLDEKMFFKKRLYKGLEEVEPYDKKQLKLLFPEHHLSHAASAFYPSGFEEAAILTVDGVGEYCTASIGMGTSSKIEILKEMHFPHSVGLLYSAFTYYLGFRVNSGEYKLMGLAPYGNPHDASTKDYINKIKDHLININEDGSIWLDSKYFNYSTGLTMTKDAKWNKLFDLKRREPSDELTQNYCNLAFAIQKVTEEIVLLMAEEVKRLTNAKYLCMAGGVALNCVANGKLVEAGIFEEVFFQPASGDAGGSLGAALAANYLYFDQKRDNPEGKDAMKGSYLGPDYSNKEIELTNRKNKAKVHKYDEFGELAVIVAKEIADGASVGWFQGRMEFGPRALGNRSIIADPRNETMQKKLNLQIKYRESFRPFAPSVLAERAKDYFKMDIDSPYMLLVSEVQESIRKEIPDNYHQLDSKAKLYTERSEIPAVTHLDFSARVQTVHRETNLEYWTILKAFEEKTGCPILINTSFNVRGEPIVCTPADAYACFMATEMDLLVIGNYLYYKKEQANWDDKELWKRTFKMD